MTVDEYYASVRAAGLRACPAVSTVYLDHDNYPWHVDDPRPMTPEQRKETLAYLQLRRGLGPPPF